MSSSSSPTNPSAKPKAQPIKKLFHKLFSSPSKLPRGKANASTPTLSLSAQGTQTGGGYDGAGPRASFSDAPIHGHSTSGLVVTTSLGTVGSPSGLVPPSISVNFNQDNATSLLDPTAPVGTLVTNTGNSEAQDLLSSSTLKQSAKITWDGFKVVAKNVEAFLDGTPFKIPVTVLNKLIETADAVIDNKESMAELLLPIGERLNILCKGLESADKGQLPKDIKPTLQRFAGLLEGIRKELKDMHDRGLFKRILECDEDSKAVADIFRQVDEATKNFELELSLANFKQLNTVMKDVEVSRLRDLHPCLVARRGGHKRETCIANTRKTIMENILLWCKGGSTDTPIYWLSGMAGTGKSTIAFTICEQLASDRDASRLAASFFCSRQNEATRKRSNVIPTIAHELALRIPGFRRALLDAQVDANPPGLNDQLKELLVKPWDASVTDHKGLPPLIVVIDALDELESSDGSYFLEQLIKEIANHPDHLQGLRFFITSRQDPRIVAEIEKDLSHNTVFRLEEVPTTTVNEDIRMYLTVSLPQLPDDELHDLSNQASGLFIYAATAIRFIKPSSENPPIQTQKRRLQALLKAWPDKSHLRTGEALMVDHLYEDILKEYFSPMAEVERPLSLAVLHTVLCTEEPILVSDIFHFWNKLEMEEDLIRDVLEHLHSVLYISAGFVYSYHKSFTDFMLDPSRFNDQKLAKICCPPSDIQFHLASSCFHLMESLKFNICDLPSSFLDDSDVPGLQPLLSERLPSPLCYACRHWGEHLSKIVPGDPAKRQDIIDQMQHWLCERWLFWIEAMNLLEVIGECYQALMTVRQWLGIEKPELQKNLIAVQNLVTVFGTNTLARSTPHLYLSALAIAPQDSDLMKMWFKRFPRIPIVNAELTSGRLLSLLQLDTHTGQMNTMAFSHDRSRAITDSSNGTVHIWDVSKGKQLFQLDGHTDSVTSVALSHDGSHAISGSNDKTVRIWELDTGKQLLQLDGHTDCVYSVAFSHNGSYAISGSDDKTVRIWEVDTGKQLLQLDGHTDTVNSVAFSHDGSCAISGSYDKTVCIWDTDTGKQLLQLDGHTAQVTSVAFLHNGSRVISGSFDMTVRIWDVDTGKQLLQLDGHTRTVTSVAFSHDGSCAISGSGDHTVRIWDIETGKQLLQLDGHTNWVNSVAFLHDGSRAISGSGDKTVRIWDVDTGKKLLQLDGHTDWVNSVTFSHNGSHAISGSNDKTVRVWEVDTGKQLLQLDGHTGFVNSVAFSHNGSHIISGSGDHTVRIWEVDTGKQMLQLDGHTAWVNSVAFSHNGSHAISGSADKTVRIWDVDTGKQLLQLDGHTDWVTSVAFSHDRSHAISGSCDQTVRIWEVDTEKQLLQLDGHTDQVNSVAFSHDGSRAISGSEDKTVCIWEVDTGKQLLQLDGHMDCVNSVAFSHDGSHAISGSDDHTVRIWEVDTGKQVLQLDGHMNDVLSVALSHDGSHAISGSRDQTVHIWEVDTGKQLIQPDREMGWMTSVREYEDQVSLASSLPDGPCAISASDDGMNHTRRPPHLSNGQWHVKKNGWITSSASEQLMWLPSDMCRVLQTPQCLVISSSSVTVDFTNACVGPEWAKCYKPNM